MLTMALRATVGSKGTVSTGSRSSHTQGGQRGGESVPRGAFDSEGRQSDHGRARASPTAQKGTA